MHPSLSQPPHLVGLTITNDPPPAAAIQEVEELLTKSNQELLEAHAEVLRFKEKAECLQHLVNSYRAILSPCRSIPQDILREIFYHCLPAHRNSIMSATEAPVVLTRVCSLWRSVALTTPHIWAKIHIPIPGHPASSSRYARHLPESALAKRRRILQTDETTLSGCEGMAGTVWNVPFVYLPFIPNQFCSLRSTGMRRG